MGYWDQAWDHMEIYFKVHDQDHQAIYLKGKIEQHRRPGDTMVAATYYQKAVDLKRDFAPAHLALGMIHYKAGRLQTAQGYFETGLALAPDNQENPYIEQYLKRCRDQ
jgi:tetratricopeptide (TPR) repeat protein